KVAHTTGAARLLPGMIAPLRLVRLWTTILGAPVVPDVNRIHSVSCDDVRSTAPGLMFGPQRTRVAMDGRFISAAEPSVTTAFTSAVSITYGRCSAARSGGQITMRRAMPSTSSRASAAASWLAVRTSTEPPRSASASPSSDEPPPRALIDTSASGAHRDRSVVSPARFVDSQSEAALARGILVELDEVSEGDRELDVAARAERIVSERVLEPSDDNREAERIEA